MRTVVREANHRDDPLPHFEDALGAQLIDPLGGKASSGSDVMDFVPRSVYRPRPEILDGSWAFPRAKPI